MSRRSSLPDSKFSSHPPPTQRKDGKLSSKPLSSQRRATVIAGPSREASKECVSREVSKESASSRRGTIQVSSEDVARQVSKSFVQRRTIFSVARAVYEAERKGECRHRLASAFLAILMGVKVAVGNLPRMLVMLSASMDLTKRTAERLRERVTTSTIELQLPSAGSLRAPTSESAESMWKSLASRKADWEQRSAQGVGKGEGSDRHTLGIGPYSSKVEQFETCAPGYDKASLGKEQCLMVSPPAAENSQHNYGDALRHPMTNDATFGEPQGAVASPPAAGSLQHNFGDALGDSMTNNATYRGPYCAERAGRFSHHPSAESIPECLNNPEDPAPAEKIRNPQITAHPDVSGNFHDDVASIMFPKGASHTGLTQRSACVESATSTTSYAGTLGTKAKQQLANAECVLLPNWPENAADEQMVLPDAIIMQGDQQPVPSWPEYAADGQMPFLGTAAMLDSEQSFRSRLTADYAARVHPGREVIEATVSSHISAKGLVSDSASIDLVSVGEEILPTLDVTRKASPESLLQVNEHVLHSGNVVLEANDRQGYLDCDVAWAPSSPLLPTGASVGLTLLDGLPPAAVPAQKKGRDGLRRTPRASPRPGHAKVLAASAEIPRSLPPICTGTHAPKCTSEAPSQVGERDRLRLDTARQASPKIHRPENYEMRLHLLRYAKLASSRVSDPVGPYEPEAPEVMQDTQDDTKYSPRVTKELIQEETWQRQFSRSKPTASPRGGVEALSLPSLPPTLCNLPARHLRRSIFRGNHIVTIE